MSTSFFIKNNTARELVIIREPEAIEFVLPIQEEVLIDVDSCPESVELKVEIDEHNKAFISILGYKSEYDVYYKGKIVFEK